MTRWMRGVVESGAGEGWGHRRRVGDTTESVVRRKSVVRFARLKTRRRIGELVQRAGYVFDVRGFHDAVAVERRDPFVATRVVGERTRASVVGRARDRSAPPGLFRGSVLE